MFRPLSSAAADGVGTRRGFAPLRLSAEQVVKVVEWRGEIV